MIRSDQPSKSLKVFLLFTWIVCVTTISWGQSTLPKIDGDERKAVVERISELIIDNYVYPDIAKKSAANIKQQLEAGEYSNFDDAEAFAKKLTEDLQSINHDKHMRVRIRRPDRVVTEREDPEVARARRDRISQENNYGFEKVERLEGNVGYLDFRYFSGDPRARKPAAGALEFSANADAIVIDMRKNGGGNPGMVQFICSYFFGEKTHLNSLYWRRGDRTQEFWTLDEIPGKRMPDVPLFVLTSSRTFSGAEEFTYNFKTRNRATVVGETTGGGANPGGTRAINDHFNIFIPTGRAINPVTGTNWEGVGVKPDVDVPADSAFNVAYRLAKIAAETYRNEQLDSRISGIKELYNQLASGKELLTNDKEKAQRMIGEALEKGIEKSLIGEPDINRMGYQHLGEKNHAMAVVVFKFNTMAYPESFNTYDSLGEAYMENGDKELAIKVL